MDHNLNGEIASARVDDMIARADSYRLAQPVSRHEGSSRAEGFLARRALAAVALSVLLVFAFASASLGVPPDSGGGGGSEGSIVKTSHKERGVVPSGLPIAAPLIVLAAGTGFAILLVAARRRFTARA